MEITPDIVQDKAEFLEFLELIAREQIKSYLEIGSYRGGSLWTVTHALPAGARVVAVDLPGRESNRQRLEDRVIDLRLKGYDAHLIIGDSADPAVIDKARALGPYDLCLIDGCHTEEYVRGDWTNYGPMARVVAFHDIAEKLDKSRMMVMEVWNELKVDYRHVEISRCHEVNGIGVLWR